MISGELCALMTAKTATGVPRLMLEIFSEFCKSSAAIN